MIINVIRTLLSGGHVNIQNVLAQVLSSLFVIFCILPLHEFAHALVADKLGDPTPRSACRLTMNPLASIDPMGSMFLLLVGFGWAKPVPVDPYYFKKPKRDMALTALAGPLSNLLAALAAAFVMMAIAYLTHSDSVVRYIIVNIFYYSVIINVSLAVFNLIPVHPLDGSRILNGLLSYRAAELYGRYRQILYGVLMFAMITGALSRVLGPIDNAIVDLLFRIASLPFKAFGA